MASGEGDSLVKDAGELEADNHVADDHEIRIDRADPICAQGRLEHDVGTCSVRFSPLQSIMHDGGSDHVDGLRRSTSMKLELDSVDEFSSGFHGQT